MHVFLMLYSNDKKSENEGIALQLTIKNILWVLEDVHSNAIAIDKTKTKYDSYRVVIQKDPHHWECDIVV